MKIQQTLGIIKINSYLSKRDGLNKGGDFKIKLKQIGGVSFASPLIGIAIIAFFITLNFIFNPNHASALPQYKTDNKGIYDDLSDIKSFKPVSCNLSEQDIERIKNAFGNYYEILIKNLSEHKYEHYNGKTCIINNSERNALVIIDKNQVLGKVSIDGFAYRTKNFDEYLKSQKEMAGVWTGVKGQGLFTIGSRSPRYEVPYVETDRTIVHNGKTVVKNLKDRSLYDIRSFYKVGAHDIYLITQADDFQECPREFLFLVISEGNKTMVLPETPFCGIDDEFKEEVGDDSAIITFKKDKNYEFIVTINKETFESKERKITNEDLENRAWKN